MVKATEATRAWGLRIYAALLVIIGVSLAFGGARLTMLGGSSYYLLAGLTVIGSGVLLVLRRREGALLYALMFLATLAWAVWEVDFDGWSLLPRLAGPFVLGLWLLTPWCRRALTAGRSLPRPAVLLIAAGAAIVIGAGLRSVGPEQPPDPIYQTGMTAAPQASSDKGATNVSGDWVEYGADAGGSRFSPLSQITPANVDKLEVAWTYRTGPDPTGTFPRLEVTPLKIDRTVYFCTAYNDVIALEAETGREKWRARSGADMSASAYSNCRGVAHYRVAGATGECAERIYTGTSDARLIALDAATGKRCADFGRNGEVSLLAGMGQVGQGYYFVTSAPTIVRGRIVLGGWVADGQYWGEPSGVIRAFDALTGRLAWAFDMGRPDRQGEPPPGETYTRSTPNSWAPMSADEALGLVYAPMGNTTGSDYYGGQRRPFDDQYSSAVVAIDAETGKLRWSFQTTHHDLWDYDVPSQPTLIDIPGPNGTEHALIQPTKRGELFLLDRVTGRPLATVEERPVPQSGHAPGERLSPTQPFAVGMPSLAGPTLRESDMWGITPLDQLWCRIEFRETRYDGTMTPPGLVRNLVYPGYSGGSNWGGVTVDTDRHILVANAVRLANRVRLIPRADADRQGIKPSSSAAHADIGGTGPQAETPYAAEVAPFLSPLRAPCQSPPYGTISGIDLVSRKLIWTGPLGTARGSGPMGLHSGLPLLMGVPGFGGAITTRGGVTFIGAVQDGLLHAYDTRTGRILWNAVLPAGGQATPMSYLSPDSGRQFVLIAASGYPAGIGVIGDYIVAYALPRREIGSPSALKNIN